MINDVLDVVGIFVFDWWKLIRYFFFALFSLVEKVLKWNFSQQSFEFENVK